MKASTGREFLRETGSCGGGGGCGVAVGGCVILAAAADRVVVVVWLRPAAPVAMGTDEALAAGRGEVYLRAGESGCHGPAGCIMPRGGRWEEQVPGTDRPRPRPADHRASRCDSRGHETAYLSSVADRTCLVDTSPLGVPERRRCGKFRNGFNLFNPFSLI